MKPGAVVAILLSLLIAAALAFRGLSRAPAVPARRPAPPFRTAPKAPPSPVPGKGSGADPRVAPPATLPGFFEDCRKALLDPSRRGEAAARLRERARRDPAFRNELWRVLRDGTAGPAAREATALVLGSLPDEAVQRELSAFLAETSDPLLARSLLLALGCEKPEGEDDGIFGMPDSPWVLEGRSGLRVAVSAPLDVPEAREAAAARLGSPDADLRWLAARVLRRSVAHEDARAALLSLLRGEGQGEGAWKEDPELLSEAGAAAAEAVATGAAPEAEREGILSAILDRASEPAQAPLRLLVEPALGAVPLPGPQLDRLPALAGEGNGTDVRAWALGMMARQAARLDALDRERFARTLLSTLSRDPEGKLRDRAALALARFLPDEAVERSLARALEADPAWNVRAAAARALGGAGGSRGGREGRPAAALRAAAASDPEPAVRRAAEESLRLLEAGR